MWARLWRVIWGCRMSNRCAGTQCIVQLGASWACACWFIFLRRSRQWGRIIVLFLPFCVSWVFSSQSTKIVHVSTSDWPAASSLHYPLLPTHLNKSCRLPLLLAPPCFASLLSVLTIPWRLIFTLQQSPVNRLPGHIPLARHLAAVKSHYLHWGLHKMSPTPIENTLPLCASCPRPQWVVQVGITWEQDRDGWTKVHMHTPQSKNMLLNIRQDLVQVF